MLLPQKISTDVKSDSCKGMIILMFGYNFVIIISIVD